MPYQSAAQRKFFHSPGAAKAGLTKADVSTWDAASKGDTGLPEHVKHGTPVDDETNDTPRHERTESKAEAKREGDSKKGHKKPARRSMRQLADTILAQD